MNDALIVAIYVVVDETMRRLGHRSHALARVSDAEVVTVAVVAAKYFANHHERALWVLYGQGYLSGRLSTSRFNRRVHALADWLVLLLAVLGALVVHGPALICDFVVDSFPVPVCRRVRARRCRKVRGRVYCGSCAAKKERFFGWRLHLVWTLDGVPVAFELLPASYHDLTPIHELTAALPAGAHVYGDKAYNSASDEASILSATGVRLVPLRKANMIPNTAAEQAGLRAFRKTIETLNSQLEAMGVQRLRARTNAGLHLKVHASLLAVTCANVH